MNLMIDGDKAIKWEPVPGARKYGYKFVDVADDGQEVPFGPIFDTTLTSLSKDDLGKFQFQKMRTYRILIWPIIEDDSKPERLHFKIDDIGRILPADPPPPQLKPPTLQSDPPQPSDKEKEEIRKLKEEQATQKQELDKVIAEAKAVIQNAAKAQSANQPAQPAAAAPSNRGTQAQTETTSAAPSGARAGAAVRQADPAATPKESTRTRDALIGVIVLILLTIVIFACVVYSKNKNWKPSWLSGHSAPATNEFGINALTEELNQLKQKLDMEARARIVAPPLPGSATLSNSVQISGTSNANGAVIVGGSIGNNNTIVVNTGSGHILAPPLIIEVETNVPPVVTNCAPTHYWTNPPAVYVPAPEPQAYYYEPAPRPVFANTYSYVGYYQYPSVPYQRNLCPPPVIRCNVRPAYCPPSRPQSSGHYGGARPGNRPRGR